FAKTLKLEPKKENFKNMISTQPQLVTRLICLLAERTWVVYRQLANLKITSKTGRVFDVLLIQLEKNKVNIIPKMPYTFEFGPNELMNMVGLSGPDGKAVIQEVFANKKFQVVDNKIVASDIDEIRKQVEYYKKMDILEQKRKTSHQNF
ncbi:MAG TPA: cAMP-binding protein, partial [Spirochaetota bacterium]|nr:cAMP-binding protein [Spirochaetota bacterium]